MTTTKIDRLDAMHLLTYARDNYTPAAVSLWICQITEARAVMDGVEFDGALRRSAPLTETEIDDICQVLDAEADDLSDCPVGYDYSYATSKDDAVTAVVSKILRDAAGRIESIAEWCDADKSP